jgi:uncharacterized protein
MKPEELLAKYFTPEALPLFLTHSRLVARKAVETAKNHPEGKNLDLEFIEEAALLHDIGVARTLAPGLGCHGKAPYIMHGIIGREILEHEGLPHHGLICERHIGVGLTVADIKKQNLPLPLRDMVPVTTEEKIVAFADLFFSKKPGIVTVEKTVETVRRELARFGDEKLLILDDWIREFTGTRKS